MYVVKLAIKNGTSFTISLQDNRCYSSCGAAVLGHNENAVKGFILTWLGLRLGFLVVAFVFNSFAVDVSPVSDYQPSPRV